ncbi:MAG TPA: hypothetical protein VF624_13660 [Tepidisphaeraceae bacterium]|jgi:hypothetical protein
MRRSAFIFFPLIALTAISRGEPALPGMVAPEVAPATQPAATATDAAGDLTGRFVAWLTADPAAAGEILADAATHITFDKSKKTDARQLAGRFAGGRVIAIATYTGRPVTMATDLSQQVAAAEGVPAGKTAALIVPAARTARANQVAGDFVVDVLGADETDTVGVAVIWYPDVKGHSLLNGATPEMTVAMVLFVAPAAAEGALLQIARVASGDVAAAK